MSHKGQPANKPANPAKPEGEKKADKKTPRERFLTVGGARMTKTLRNLRNLRNVSSRKSYEYSAEDVSKMLSALKTELAGLEKTFETALSGGKASTEKEVFKF